MRYYLYNSCANNGIRPSVEEGIELIDALGMDYPNFFAGLKAEDEVVLLGGDGTLNYFINAMKDEEIKNNVYLLGSGTGNDFFNDIERNAGEIVQINRYIKDLPTVSVNGITAKFINNMGFGIDGYCCEVADQIKKESPNTEIDYSSIAIQGLLGKFSKRDAEVTIDGVTKSFKNVWICPTMKGRYYGGGMKVAPKQDRFSGELSVVVYHCPSRLISLINFPKVSKGVYKENGSLVTVLTGKKIHVRFSKPCAAQIDGETVLNVSEYDAEA